MKLDRVQIKNFRSIQETEINFDPPCRALVGINESGKSNILRALALLSSEIDPVKKNDLREALPDEAPITQSYVRFVFKFEKDESDALRDRVSSAILARAKNPPIVTLNGRPQKLKDFCASRDEGLYVANIPYETKGLSYWAFGNQYTLLPGWKKPSSACPKDFSFEHKGQSYTLAQYTLIWVADFSDIPEGYLEDASLEDFTRLVAAGILAITKDNLPDTLLWEYDENNLLPSSVNLAAFSDNPDLCVPLKNMFTLAGIENIKTSIEDARAGSDNQFQNYLNRIAKQTTNHFREVWKEYRNIEFSLQLNADQIIPGVKEQNTHDFARRSDGFKRFVTFLLMISVNVRADLFRNTLLLIDEPDTSLHPSGARYLRDELIRISKTNYVVYSSHSIFMIDPGDISRHYIVKKKYEITNLESAQDSNIADEEVIHNALGHSVFSILKGKNLIFEGWKDQRLFQLALDDAPADLKKKYKDVGICHARGVSTIKAITPLIELARRECLIISDSGKPAKEQQKIYRQEKGFGEWRNYQEIDPAIDAVTGEDFIKNEWITKKIRRFLAAKSMPAFDQNILPERKGKVAAISRWLSANGMTADQTKDTVAKIKNAIFENLRHQDIEDTYTTLLRGISL